MSIESLNRELARLEEDVRRLSQDSAQLGADPAVQTPRAAAAVIDDGGSLLESLAKIGDVHRDQFRALLEDHRESFHALLDVHSPLELFDLGVDHWKRRSAHVAAGLTRVVAVVVSGSKLADAQICRARPVQ